MDEFLICLFNGRWRWVGRGKVYVMVVALYYSVLVVVILAKAAGELLVNQCRVSASSGF